MKKIFTLIVMLAATLGMQAQDTWTVAGEKALCGSSWDPTDATNDMTATGDIFTLVKENVMLTVKGYEFKVVKNHSWDESYGAGDGNASVQIEEDGAYTVTFTFNPTTLEPLATAVKTGEYVKPVVGDQTWTVAGVAELCGNEWDPADASNDMTSEDGVHYTLTKTGLPLEAGRGYGFKVVADHSWDEAYPGENYQLIVNANGEYTVVFTFDAETHEVGAEATKTGEHDFGTKIWTSAGAEALMGSNWDQTDSNNDMTDVGDGIYILVKENVALLADTEYEFKVLANHSWSENYGADGVADGANVVLTVSEDGNYDVTFTFMLESKDLSADAELSTGIKNITLNNGNTAVIYNLQGQRVQDSFRGIAVMNGRKFVVK